MISAHIQLSKMPLDRTGYWRELVITTRSYMIWGAAAFSISVLAYALYVPFTTISPHRNLAIELIAIAVALKVGSGIYADFYAYVAAVRGRARAASSGVSVPNVMLDFALAVAAALLSPKFIDMYRMRRQGK